MPLGLGLANSSKECFKRSKQIKCWIRDVKSAYLRMNLLCWLNKSDFSIVS